MKRLPWLMLLALSTYVVAQQTITIPVIVVSGNSGSIPLKADDLEVEVNDQRLAVASITSLAGEHLEYVLMNDRSRSTRWPGGIRQQTDVATQFLKQVITPGADIGSLVNFADEVYIDVHNSGNPDEIAAKLDRSGSGGTRMYEAIVSTARWLGKQAAVVDHRKAIFPFSDGEDNRSRTGQQKVTKTLQELGSRLFVIAPTEVQNKKDGKILRQISEGSGGRVYFLPQDGAQTDFQFLKQDLKRSYLLTVNATSPLGQTISIAIRDVVHPEITFIAPSQLFAP